MPPTGYFSLFVIGTQLGSLLNNRIVLKIVTHCFILIYGVEVQSFP